MKKMIFDIGEAVLFVIILSFVFKTLKNYNNNFNSIIVVLLFLVLWVIIKMGLKRFFNGKENK